METTITKPSADVDQKIVFIQTTLLTKDWQAVIQDGDDRELVNFNIQPLLDLMTTTQKTTVKTFLRRCALQAINVYNSDIGVTITDVDLVGDPPID